MKRRIGRGGRAKEEPAEDGREEDEAPGASGQGGGPGRARTGKGRPAGKGSAKGGRHRPGVCPYCGHTGFEQLVVERSVAGIVTESHHLDYADCGRCRKKFNWRTGKPHQGTVDALTYGGVAFLVLVVVVFLLTRRH